MAETGNKVIQNFGLNPATNFNFILRVEGLFDLPCKSVRVFQKENEYEYIQEGGLNDYVHMRRKPVSKPFTFQVERYVGVDGLLVDYLANGTELVLPLVLLVNRYHWNGYPYPTRTYVFTGCTVIGKEYGELNAEKSGLLVETTTIAYREMVNVDVGIGANAMDPWKFDEKKYSGKGKQYARHPEKEERKEKRLQSRRLWDPSGKKVAASQSSARHPETGNQEETEGQEQKERLWKFDEKSYSGKGQKSARRPENEERKEKRQKNTRLWDPSGKKSEKSQSSARRQENTKKKDDEEQEQQERLWQFDDKKYSGAGQKSARYPENEMRKEERQKETRLWDTSGKKTEKSQSSARHPEDFLNGDKEQETGETEEKTPRKWPGKRSARTVADYLGSREKESR